MVLARRRCHARWQPWFRWLFGFAVPLQADASGAGLGLRPLRDSLSTRNRCTEMPDGRDACAPANFFGDEASDYTLALVKEKGRRDDTRPFKSVGRVAEAVLLRRKYAVMRDAARAVADESATRCLPRKLVLA